MNWTVDSGQGQGQCRGFWQICEATAQEKTKKGVLYYTQDEEDNGEDKTKVQRGIVVLKSVTIWWK